MRQLAVQLTMGWMAGQSRLILRSSPEPAPL